MFRRKMKDYRVTIIFKDKQEDMLVNGYSKAEVLDIITDLLIKSSLWSFKSKDEFKLKCKREHIEH
jgi:hypothetical protein